MSRHSKTLFRSLVIVLCLDWFVALGASPAGATGSAPSVIEKPSKGWVIHARFALHRDFDRLALKLPPGVTVVFRQDGENLLLKLTGTGELTGNAVAGKRMLSMARGQSDVLLRVAIHARVRSWRNGDLFVIDVFDPDMSSAGPLLSIPDDVGPTRPPALEHDVNPARMIASRSASQTLSSINKPMAGNSAVPKTAIGAASITTVDLPTPLPHTPALTPTPAEPEQRSPDVQSGFPHPVSITLLKESPFSGPALLVPFGRDVGAAAFPRGEEARVVFDVPQSFDLSGLKDDPVFGNVTEQLLPDGMQLRLRLGPVSGLILSRREDGWVISLPSPGQSNAQFSPITGQNRQGVTEFDLSAAGKVVIVPDELTGGRLIVGTQRVGGQHVGNPHLSAEAVVLPTWQGVVVQPISDRVLLRATQSGYELSSISLPPLAMIWSDQRTGAWPDGRSMTRLFDFSNSPPEALHRQLGQALRDAAATPKLSRFSSRIGVAKAMLAQGMDVEAFAVIQTAQADDPAGQDGRCADCLAALAFWMSARAGGVDAPRLSIDPVRFGDSDEAALLKALFVPSSNDIAGQAATVATTWPFLLSYPSALRRFMLEPVANLLLKGGQQKALSAFLTAFSDGSLDLARANFAKSQGKIDDCLKLYAQVAGGRDRLARANALEQIVLVKLAANRMSSEAGAEALSQQLYAWRGGDRELRLRQQVAKLRAQAGQWRSAVAMLNDTAQKFPQSHADVHAAKSDVVKQLLNGDNLAKLNVMDLIAIAEGTSDVMDSSDVSFAPAMIDKLLALDLAARADPIMRRLFQSAKDPRTKAELGVRLAESMIDGSDPAAVLSVLAASDDADLGAAVVSRRALLRARLLSQVGKSADALAALHGLHSQEASELQATIMESQHDWTGAVSALKPLIFNAVFAALPQTTKCDLLLRLARDEAEAGDQAGLHTLHQTQAAQFQSSPNSALFAVLTAEPVRSTADLPRSSTEVRAFRAVPASIARARSF